MTWALVAHRPVARSPQPVARCPSPPLQNTPQPSPDVDRERPPPSTAKSSANVEPYQVEWSEIARPDRRIHTAVKPLKAIHYHCVHERRERPARRHSTEPTQ